MSNILGEITSFLGQRAHKTLELHFYTQEIMSFRNGEPRPDKYTEPTVGWWSKNLQTLLWAK